MTTSVPCDNNIAALQDVAPPAVTTVTDDDDDSTVPDSASTAANDTPSPEAFDTRVFDFVDLESLIPDFGDIDLTVGGLDALDQRGWTFAPADPHDLPQDDNSCCSILDDASYLDMDLGVKSTDDLDDDAYLDYLASRSDLHSRALYSASRSICAIGNANIFYKSYFDGVKNANVSAHVDGGAQVGTTDRRELLWHLSSLPENHPVVLRVADQRPHRPTHRGYLAVPDDSVTGYFLSPCYLTPTLAATILSPDQMADHYQCRGYSALCVRNGVSCLSLVSCRRGNAPTSIPLEYRRGLLFTRPLVAPRTVAERTSPLPRATVPSCVFATRDSAAAPSATDSATASSTPDSPATDSPVAPSVATSDAVPLVVPVDDSSLAPGGTSASVSAVFSPLTSPSDSPLASTSVPTLASTSAAPVSLCSSDATVGTCPSGSSCGCLAPDTFLPPGVPSSSASPPVPVSSVPSSATCEIPSTPCCPPTDHDIHHLTRDQLRVLWHNRLAHLHFRRTSNLHKLVKGLPELPIGTDLDKCSTCLHSKARHADRSHLSSRRATQCGQGISIDFGFMCQASKDTDRMERLSGLNGETCYVLIADHYSRTLYGRTFRSKRPPVEYLNSWLATHGCDRTVKDKYVRFDLGGELGRSPAVVDLFERAGYHVEPTAPAASSQNGPVERMHQTIAIAIRSMLAGAGLSPKYWPYCFHHFLHLHNLTPHGSQDAGDESPPPLTMCTGRIVNLSHLKTFGCRVYVVPPRPTRPDAPVSDTRTGIFLGFGHTLRNILYQDAETREVRSGTHVSFDETFNDLPYHKRPPDARALADHHPSLKKHLGSYPVSTPVVYPDLEIAGSPFLAVKKVRVHLRGPDSDCPLGVDFDQCARLDRPFITAVRRAGVKLSAKTFRKHYLGAYVVAVGDHSVFTIQDLQAHLKDLLARPNRPSTVELHLAPERQTSFDDRSDPLHLRVNQLRHIRQVLDGCTCGSSLSPAPSPGSLDGDIFHLSPLLARLTTDSMTPEERALPRLTRRHLQTLPNWSEWEAAFDKQLEQQYEATTFGNPILRPKTPPGGDRPHICRPQWSNQVKVDGRRKCRVCLDGSPRSAPWLHQLSNTYASSVDLNCMRLFFGLAASKNLTMGFADTTNAFQQSPGPSIQCYLEVDDAISDWWYRRTNSKVRLVPGRHVIPLNKALQGHPEAGRLWEGMIEGILSELDFKNTTHERSLYRSTIDGHVVLICRQIDDFAIAAASDATITKVIDHINSRVTTTAQGSGTVSLLGSTFHYNGIDVCQARDFTKVHCETYIDRLLDTHGWTTPPTKESDRHDLVPLASSLVPVLYDSSGPAENSPAAVKLAADLGFSYRQVLGELIYAYVICRPDIGYAITLLSRFSGAPDRCHYDALKNVVKFLRATKSRGIYYWRSAPNMAFPSVPFDPVIPDSTLPTFPSYSNDALVGFVDAAHATELRTRRSVTGYGFVFAGGVVAYKSKVQATVATSSTEAEFIAAVSAAKVARYLRSVLSDLGFAPSAATPLYVDNQAAIAMVNQSKPTARSRHIDIQHFAIQEWRERGLIILHHIPGVINPSDAATKAVGWTLHSRHTRRLMGHYGRP